MLLTEYTLITLIVWNRPLRPRSFADGFSVAFKRTKFKTFWPFRYLRITMCKILSCHVIIRVCCSKNGKFILWEADNVFVFFSFCLLFQTFFTFGHFVFSSTYWFSYTSFRSRLIQSSPHSLQCQSLHVVRSRIFFNVFFISCTECKLFIC